MTQLTQTYELDTVEVRTKQGFLGLSWSIFDEYRVRNVVLSGHLRARECDIPV